MSLNLKKLHSTTERHPRKLTLGGEEVTAHIRKLPSSKLRKVLAESVHPDVDVRCKAGNLEMAEAITGEDGETFTARDFELLPLREWNVLFKAFMDVQGQEDAEAGNA